MQLFSTDSKVLVSCKEAGPCEGYRRRGAKAQCQHLDDTHCCPLSFCIDHRCHWRRATKGTQIVAICCCSDDSRRTPTGHTCADAMGVCSVRQAGCCRQCQRARYRIVDLALINLNPPLDIQSDMQTLERGGGFAFALKRCKVKAWVLVPSTCQPSECHSCEWAGRIVH